MFRVLEPAGFPAVVTVAAEIWVNLDHGSVAGLVNQYAWAGDKLEARGHLAELVDDFGVVLSEAGHLQLSDAVCNAHVMTL
jgi:hypothetical protein